MSKIYITQEQFDSLPEDMKENPMFEVTTHAPLCEHCKGELDAHNDEENFQKLERTMNSDKLSWQEKFEHGFKCTFSYSGDYYDPGTTYKADITAYYNHIKEQREKFMGF